jgi:hypothetical protein
VEYPWSSSDIARKIRSLGHEKSAGKAAGKYTLDSVVSERGVLFARTLLVTEAGTDFILITPKSRII